MRKKNFQRIPRKTRKITPESRGNATMYCKRAGSFILLGAKNDGFWFYNDVAPTALWIASFSLLI